MRSPVWLTRFWSTDRGLSVLLGSLVVLIFVIPPLRFRAEATAVLLVQVFFTLVLISGLSATTPSRAARVVAWAMAPSRRPSWHARRDPMRAAVHGG